MARPQWEETLRKCGYSRYGIKRVRKLARNHAKMAISRKQEKTHKGWRAREAEKFATQYAEHRAQRISYDFTAPINDVKSIIKELRHKK